MCAGFQFGRLDIGRNGSGGRIQEQRADVREHENADLVYHQAEYGDRQNRDPNGWRLTDQVTK
jgi:hypothetical protein